MSKFMTCVAIPDAEASTVAKVFFEQIITRFNIPRVLVTDNGTNFTSKLFSETCKMLGVKKVHISPYQYQVQRGFKIARENLEKAKKTSKKGYDVKTNPISFEPDSLVLFKNLARKNKFSTIWLGPYEVVRGQGATNTIIRVKGREKVVHNNSLRKFNKFMDIDCS